MTILEDIINIRQSSPLGGSNPSNYVELYGGILVQIERFEPDAETYRENYYYNSRINKLFKKINTQPKKVWKQI